MNKQSFSEFAATAPAIILITEPSETASDFMPTIEAPSNYKDLTKIDAYIDERVSKFLSKAALDALTGRILGLTLYSRVGSQAATMHRLVDTSRLPLHEGVQYEFSDAESGNSQTFFACEEDLLKDVAAFLPACGGLIGHNLHGFILPFLVRRMLRFRIEIPERFLPRPRYFDQSTAFDTAKAWAMGKKDDEFTSMKHLLLHLAIDPGKEMPLAFTESETFPARYAVNPDASLADVGMAATIVHEAAEVLWGAFGSKSTKSVLTINELRAAMPSPYPPIEGGNVLD